MVVEHVHNSAVLNLNTLGLAGRARGVNHVCKIDCVDTGLEMAERRENCARYGAGGLKHGLDISNNDQLSLKK
jgi:hypothetical protein